MRMIRQNLKQILRISMMLMPVDADGARKRRTKATTTASTKSKKTKKKTTRRRTSTKTTTTVTPTVTQATREAAIQASGGEKKPAASSKNRTFSKIEVSKPDLEEIRVSSLDPKSKYYFPKLMKKYQQNDTVMTPDEFRYLYLGYMFQEDYDPYRDSPYSKVTEDLRLKTEHSKEEIDTIRKYAEKALNDNPFDLRQMSFLVHVLKERRKDMSAKIWEFRLENLLAAIKSTGTGEDVENAWFVIYPMHEYDMVQLLGYEAVDVDYIEPGYDYLMVEPEESSKITNPVKGFYFNYIMPQQQYELKHPEEVAGEEETVLAVTDEET